jgi:hypothetical protein
LPPLIPAKGSIDWTLCSEKKLSRGWEHGNYFTLPAAEIWLIDGKETRVVVGGLFTEIDWV